MASSVKHRDMKRWPIRSANRKRHSGGQAALVERLEDRTLLSLVGVAPEFPIITYDSTGTIAYSAADQTFDLAATPLSFKETAASRPRTPTDASMAIHIQVDNDGNLVGGVPGDDLVVTGDIDIDGDGNIDVSGVLLTGEIAQFGFDQEGGDGLFDFSFAPTGGALASYFAGNYIGVTTTAENTTFDGTFTADFHAGSVGTSGAKGNIGLIPPVISPPAALGDFVWLDTNADGIQQGDEPGVANVAVHLSGADDQGPVSLDTVTDSSGYYLFDDLRAGTYQVTFDLPAGYVFTLPNQGANTGLDSDADRFTGTTAMINLSAGQVDLTWDAGLITSSVDIEKYVKTQSTCTCGGRTPGYWKQCQHYSSWTGCHFGDSYNTIFGVHDRECPTLLSALQRGGGGCDALGRQAVAGLLNAMNPSMNYAYSPMQVINMVRGAYACGDFETVKNLLAAQNEAGEDYSPNCSTTPTCPQPSGDPGIDADTAPGLSAKVGSTIKFTYYVTNTGQTALAHVTVHDDNATPANPGDDFNPTPVMANGYNVGDANHNGMLDPGETWQYTASATVTAGQHTNLGDVIATPVNAQGRTLAPDVTDSDPANWFGGSICPPPPPTPACISGLVYLDKNNNGQPDSCEPGIKGVTVTLTGIDDDGHNVTRTTVTDCAGKYSFCNLDAGTYTLTETQPAGYLDGLDMAGSLGGAVADDVISQIVVDYGDKGVNYDFGEQLKTCNKVAHGDTATIGFWNNKNGQALIESLNGGKCAKSLGNWLAANFPHLYSGLAGKTNAQVADYFQTLFNKCGQKLEAQVMAAALAVYVTNSSLAGNAAAKYGFDLSGHGTGDATWNIGSNGAAFGVTNGSTHSVMDLLEAIDGKAKNGTIYATNKTLRDQANTVFSAINQAGDIG